jgi:carboxymethylenebutenolidase
MGEMIEFPSNSHTCSGYLATPRSGRGAGIVVIQEWWGLVTHIKDVCDRLAAEGFMALAPDLYHGETTKEPDEAGKMAMGLRIDDAAKDIAGAVNWLAGSERTTGNRVGIVGFCMGGALALFAASQNSALAAVVSFYPALGLPAVQQLDVSTIEGAVLVHLGGVDHAYTREQVEEIERRLKGAGADVEAFWYEKADHAFFNDARPEVYRPEAAQLAWDRTLAFFRKHLVMTAAPVS